MTIGKENLILKFEKIIKIPTENDSPIASGSTVHERKHFTLIFSLEDTVSIRICSMQFFTHVNDLTLSSKEYSYI